MHIPRPVHKGIRIFLATFWLFAFSFLLYAMQARGFDPVVLTSDDVVQVHTIDGTIDFRPVIDTASAGLIFYPGALVDPEAYAPLARGIAAAGYRTTIVKVPFRMDLFDWQWEEVLARTEAVMAGDSSRTKWILGGHSRGGRMAVRLAGERSAAFAGLLLVGTSHPRREDLSHLDLDVVKIYGTEDGLASVEEVERFAANLPAGTHFVRIEGGNHRQFGYYGWQLGDGRAGIGRTTQHQQTTHAIVEQLERVTASSR